MNGSCGPEFPSNLVNSPKPDIPALRSIGHIGLSAAFRSNAAFLSSTAGTVRQNELETGRAGFVASPYDKTLPIQVL